MAIVVVLVLGAAFSAAMALGALGTSLAFGAALATSPATRRFAGVFLFLVPAAIVGALAGVVLAFLLAPPGDPRFVLRLASGLGLGFLAGASFGLAATLVWRSRAAQPESAPRPGR